MKRAVQTGIFVLCVVVSVAAVYNVASDNADVEGLAATAACAGESPVPPVKPGSAAAPPACNPQKTRIERTPLAQTFEFVTAKRKVEVRCVRALVLAGDYACALR